MAINKPRGVDDPEGLATRDLLPCVITPALTGDGRRTPDRSGRPRSRPRVRGLDPRWPGPLRRGVGRSVPMGPVPRPSQVLAVHRGSSSGTRGAGPATGTRSQPHRRWRRPPDAGRPWVGRPIPPANPVVTDQISDQFPLLIGHVTMHRPPRLRMCDLFRVHQLTLIQKPTLHPPIHPLNSQNFQNNLSESQLKPCLI